MKLLPQPGICNAVFISSTRSFFVFFPSRSRSANGFSSSARIALRCLRWRVPQEDLLTVRGSGGDTARQDHGFLPIWA